MDHRANRKSYSIGGSSVEASKHTEKLSDIENFITESSKQNEKQISYQDYEKLFGLLLNSDENQVIDTIRKYKQQLNIPVDNPKDEPPKKEITESTSSVPQVKPESGRKKITHSKQITSRSEFGGKTDRSSSSANSKLAKQIPRRDKSAINDSKIPRMRKSVLSQPLISIKNKNKRRSSIVKSQNSAVESNSIIEKSDSSVYYSAVDTNIKSSKSRQKLRDEKQQDKLSLSVISSQASPKSFSDEESKHQRSLSPSSDESDDSQSEKLTKLNTPEEDEKQLFE